MVQSPRLSGICTPTRAETHACLLDARASWDNSPLSLAVALHAHLAARFFYRSSRHRRRRHARPLLARLDHADLARGPRPGGQGRERRVPRGRRRQRGTQCRLAGCSHHPGRADRPRRGRPPAARKTGSRPGGLPPAGGTATPHHHQAAHHQPPPATDPARLRRQLRGTRMRRHRTSVRGCAGEPWRGGAVGLRQGHAGPGRQPDPGGTRTRTTGGGRPQGHRFWPLLRRDGDYPEHERVRSRGGSLQGRGHGTRTWRGATPGAGPAGAADHPL
ncbi:hypothetical protein SDC9_144644 [bioreactor metagenome]|uniref:Uncharacterized protein n=1 Tax=bioreactor metagenome TaxID=1076179 RepID=A0A645E7J6_9ZZZZ